MIRKASLLVLPTLLAGLAIAGTTAAQDDGDATGRRWFIDVSYGSLKPITVRKGRDATRTLWYVCLKLTNKTGQDRSLDLTARALTGIKKAPTATPGLYPEAVGLIAKREHIKGLENVLALSGDLANGASKNVVLVFGNLTNLANHIDVRVAGLTNTLFVEGKTVWREETELSIKFYRVGDEYDVTRNEVRDLGKSWITLRRTKVRG